MVRGGWGFYNDDFTADVFSPLYGGPFSLTESFVNTITNNTPALTFQRPLTPPSAMPQTVLLFTSIWYTTLRSPPE